MLTTNNKSNSIDHSYPLNLNEKNKENNEENNSKEIGLFKLFRMKEIKRNKLIILILIHIAQQSSGYYAVSNFKLFYINF